MVFGEEAPNQFVLVLTAASFVRSTEMAEEGWDVFGDLAQVGKFTAIISYDGLKDLIRIIF